MKRWYVTIPIASILLLCGCGGSSNDKEDQVMAVEEQEESITRDELRDQVDELVKLEQFDDLEKLVAKHSSILDEEEIKAAKSYLAFQRSDEPISLRAAKLMDEVEYGYMGILEIPIEQAIYTPQEEGSLISDTYVSESRTSYDYLDWKHNKKDAYEKAKDYKDIKVKAEVEKIVKEKLIEEAKTKNPTLGMTKEEVEASLWGKPEKINRSVNQYTTREQWVYGNGQYLYFTDGILTGFQD